MRLFIKKHFFARIILLVFITLIVFITINLFSETLNKVRCNRNGAKKPSHTNWVLVYFDAMLEELYYENESIPLLRNLYAELKDSKYYEILEQPLELSTTHIPAQALYTYAIDKGISSKYFDNRAERQQKLSLVQALQISENVQAEFQIQAYKGRLFEPEDFILHIDADSMNVPILLGNDYAEYYNVGDSIEGWYIFEKFSFMVAGILESETTIDIGREKKQLDNMILMPMFDMPDASINENKRVFFVRHYANKLSGKYKYDNTREADAFIEKCSELSEKTNIVFETNIIFEPIESSILLAMEDDKYSLDIFCLLLIIGTLVCSWMNVKFLRRISQIQINSNSIKNAIEITISILTAVVLWYIICGFLDAKRSIMMILFSAISTIVGTYLSYILKLVKLRTVKE